MATIQSANQQEQRESNATALSPQSLMGLMAKWFSDPDIEVVATIRPGQSNQVQGTVTDEQQILALAAQLQPQS